MSVSNLSTRTDYSVDPAGEFPLNVPEQLFYLIFHVTRHRDARIDAELAKVGLTLSRWRIMSIIRRIERCSMKDLSLYSTIDRTTLTRMIDQLEDQGLIDRRIPANDRRMVLLSLTAHGEELYAGAVKTVLELNKSLLDGVDPGQQRNVARAIGTVLGNLVNDPDEFRAIVRFGATGSD